MFALGSTRGADDPDVRTDPAQVGDVDRTQVGERCGLSFEGRPAGAEASWNAICLADFGDGGVAFFAQPQIPPRNVNWASSGKWVHLAKVAFEKYFLNKIRRGETEPFYEKMALDLMGARKLKAASREDAPVS